MTTDVTLVQQYAKTLDADVFAELVRRYSALVFGVSLRITRNAHDAEDITQECFLVLAHKAASIDRSVGGWLHKVARQLSLNNVRDKSRRARHEEQSVEEIAAQAGPVWLALHDKIDDALDSMPDDIKLPLVLHYLRGLSQKEVAAELETSQASVSRLLERGVAELREIVKRKGIDVPLAMLDSLLVANAIPAVPWSLAQALGKMALAGIEKSLIAGSASTAAGAAHGGLVAVGAGAKIVAAVAAAGIVAGGAVLVVKIQTDSSPQAVPENAAPVAADAGPKTLLGSPDFQPSPVRPLGWRGDGTGRYPGANPPTSWRFHVRTSIDELRCMAAKPANDGPAGNPLPFGRIEEWLTLGPFKPRNAATGQDESFIPNETDVSPDAGEACGGRIWQVFHAGGENHDGFSGPPGVEFDRIYGPEKDMVAYAFTRVYSPRQMDVSLFARGFRGNAANDATGVLLLNGRNVTLKPMARKGGVTVELRKGWNRILFKKCGGPVQDNRLHWRFAMSLHPVEPGAEIERKGIAWMTRMPNRNIAAPVVAGSKLFVNSNWADLICLDKSTGRILWMRPNLYHETLTYQEKKALGAEIEPMVTNLKQMGAKLIKEINDLPPPAAVPTEAERRVEAMSEEYCNLEKRISMTLEGASNGKYPAPERQHCGTSSGTPVTDGRYVWGNYGGGTFERASMVTACYDLEGNRIWARGNTVNAMEGGDHASLFLWEGKVFYGGRSSLTAFNAMNGDVLWSDDNEDFGQAQVMTVGGKPVLWSNHGMFARPTDGRLIGGHRFKPLSDFFGVSAAEGQVVYTPAGGAFSVIGDVENGVKASRKFQAAIPERKEQFRLDGHISSPLLHNGLVYVCSEGGIFSAIRQDNGEVVYSKLIRELDPCLAWIKYPGVCASPTLAGKYIYQAGDNGLIVVIQPGREYRQIAANLLDVSREHEGQALSTPVFEGNRMYYRAPNYLYCIDAE